MDDVLFGPWKTKAGTRDKCGLAAIQSGTNAATEHGNALDSDPISWFRTEASGEQASSRAVPEPPPQRQLLPVAAAAAGSSSIRGRRRKMPVTAPQEDCRRRSLHPAARILQGMRKLVHTAVAVCAAQGPDPRLTFALQDNLNATRDACSDGCRGCHLAAEAGSGNHHPVDPNSASRVVATPVSVAPTGKEVGRSHLQGLPGVERRPH